MLSIIIDDREHEVIKFTFDYTTPIVGRLDAGDYAIATEDGRYILVERKTPSDFLNSIKDDQYDKGHIFNQVTRMRQQTNECYVVITGVFVPGPDGKVWVGQRQTGWDFECVAGVIKTIQKMGCIVSFCKNEMDFPNEIRRIAADGDEVLLGVMKKSNILGPGESMLTALPGIGYETVKKMMDYGMTPAEAFCVLTDEEINIPGLNISQNKKRAIKEAVKLKPNQRCKVDYGEEIVF